MSFQMGLMLFIVSNSLEGLDEQTQFGKSTMTMVALGVGELFGSIIIGQAIDRLGSKIAALFISFFILCATTLTIVQLSLNKYNALTFAMTFMWGVQDSSVQTHSFQMMGFEFDNNYEPFAIYNLIGAVVIFAFQIGQSFVDTPEKQLIYVLCIGVFGIGATITTFFFNFKETKSKKLAEALNKDK